MKINKKAIHPIFIFIIIVCFAAYGFFAVRKENSPKFAVNIDLGKPMAIEWPCEISIIGDDGERGLRIPPKVGRGWAGEAGGKARYRFYIPEDRSYYLWGYCLWFDECANAIFVQIDDYDKAVLGNDPIYGDWHWVRGFEVKLGQGTHTLVLSNHSDHIALQKIVFSNSATFGPQQMGILFSDIFYDGFDGCDEGNFRSWRQISGVWRVANPDSGTCLIENSLFGQSQDRAFITYENKDWRSYSVDVSIQIQSFLDGNCAVGVCFGLVDPQHYYLLKIQPVLNDTTAIIMVQDFRNHLLSRFDVPFEIKEWQATQIMLEKDYIEVRLANNEPVKIQHTEEITGGIGLLLEGQIQACFDNIHVRQIIEP